MKIGKIKIPQTVLHQPGDVVDPEIFFGDTIDLAKYDDITSIESWYTYGHREKDYLYVRNQIMIIAATTGFSNLSTNEKELASTYFAVGEVDRDSIHTTDEQKGNWKRFIVNANIARKKRWIEAEAEASFILSIPDSIDLAKSTNSLSNEYITYGIEEFSADGVDGLFDWIEDTAGFSGGAGFSGKNYFTTTLRDDIMNILRHGNY